MTTRQNTPDSGTSTGRVVSNESFYFPPNGSALFEHFKPTDLIGWRHLPGFRAARQMAFEFYEKVHESVKPEHKVYLVLRANGEVALWRFGPKGAHKRLWNFGDPLKPKEKKK